MTDAPIQVDPGVLKNLEYARAAEPIFWSLGRSTEFWELLQIFITDGPLLYGEVDLFRRSPEKYRAAGTLRSMLAKLEAHRQQTGDLANRMRQIIEKEPGLSVLPAVREITLAFILVSLQGREAAARWTADPATHAEEISRKLVTLSRIAERYREELDGEHLVPLELEPEFEAVPLEETPAPTPAPEPPAPEPPAPEPPVPEAPAPFFPRGVDPEVLEDIRLVEECRRVFEETHQQIEVWEVFCLVMIEGKATRTEVQHVLDLRRNAPREGYVDAALALFEKLLAIRARYDRLVRGLRDYLPRLNVGSFSRDTMEMSLGFIIASARGRENAGRWLEEPERYKMEASGRLEYVLSRTMNYQTALRLTTPD